MPDFSIALSGLSADTVALNTIGNNLANLNTTGYKGQTTEFESLFYQQLGVNGSGDALQVGSGTQVASTTTDFSQGTIAPTTVSSDVALSGDGYFVVQQNGVQSLTRAGNFQLDSTGDLITSTGASVLGYGTADGAIDTNAPVQAITLPVGSTQAAQATTSIGVTANLDASAATGSTAVSNVTIFDSLGEQQSATITYTKSAAPNTWTYAITLPNGVASGVPTNNTGTLEFDTSGNLIPSTTVGSTTNIPPGTTFPGMVDNAADLDFTFNPFSASGASTITQTTAASQTGSTAQNGFASGTYQSFTVDQSGIVTATFSNNQTVNVGQIAVATVANNDGLVAIGNNNYTTSAASGQAQIGVAGTGSRGTVTDDALEESNVDISTEFANLIVAERAFEANSKTVTTFDTVTQDTISMVR